MRSMKIVSDLPNKDSNYFSRHRADTAVGIIHSRLRVRDKKTAFQRSLETLKRTLPPLRGTLLSQLQCRSEERSIRRFS